MTNFHGRFLLLACGVFSICAQADVPANGVSLDEAFQSAIKRTESIKNQDELIIQAEEKYKQAIGSVLPSLQGMGTYFQQKAQSPLQSNGALSSVSPTSQGTTQLQAHQYLFQGTKEYAGLRQTKDTIHAQQDLKKQALLQLYESTAQAYYSVLSADKTVEDLKSEIPLYDKWIKVLRQWISIGRARDPDVLTIETSVAQLQAQLQQDILLAQTNREAFMFITGLPDTTTMVDDVNLDRPVLQLPDAMGVIERRPEVTSQKFAIEAADEGVNIAKGGNYPTLDITGDYYFNRPNSYQGISWDFTLDLVIPIFQGGVVESQIRAAASQRAQAELTLDTNQRQLNQNIKTIYDSVIQDREQVKALVNAKEVSYKDYQAQEHDYKLGLVTNIDVLTALTAFVQSEQALDVARYTAQYDYSRLIVETGQLPELKF